jgi:3-methylcrotonyl-CoA carboxylase alpha subunit
VDAKDQEHAITVKRFDEHFDIIIDDQSIKAKGKLVDDHLVAMLNDHHVNVRIAHVDDHITVFNKQNITELVHQQSQTIAGDDQADENTLTAPMNGTIVAVLCKPEDTVLQGDNLVIMEAMKMEYTISATCDGTINEVFYQPGDLVEDGALLIDFTPSEG